jgi:hypothetical protein
MCSNGDKVFWSSHETESGGFDGNAGETEMRLGLDDDLH